MFPPIPPIINMDMIYQYQPNPYVSFVPGFNASPIIQQIPQQNPFLSQLIHTQQIINSQILQNASISASMFVQQQQQQQQQQHQHQQQHQQSQQLQITSSLPTSTTTEINDNDLASYQHETKFDDKIKFATWNVRGAVEMDKRNAIDKCLNEKMVQIACIQETKLQMNNNLETANYKWHFIHRKNDHSIHCGTAILVKHTFEAAVSNFEAVTGNILSCFVRSKELTILLISAHLTEDIGTDIEFDRLKNFLKLYESLPTIIFGDFNAQLGKSDIVDSDHVFMEKDCRAAWANLRNSARYYNKRHPVKASKGKTGDSASADEGLADGDCEEILHWELEKHMEFLKPMWRKYARKTTVLGMQFQNNPGNVSVLNATSANEKNDNRYVSVPNTNDTAQNDIVPNDIVPNDIVPNDIEPNDRCDMELNDGSYIKQKHGSVIEELNSRYATKGNDVSVIELNVTKENDSSVTESNSDADRSYGELSNYAYATAPSKKDVLSESVVNITKSITELVMCRKTEMGRNVQQDDRLKFDYMWRNFDKLLQKLPESDVDELNFTFMHLIHEKLRKNSV